MRPFELADVEILNSRQVAEIIGSSPVHARAWCAKNGIRAWNVGLGEKKGRLRYRKSDVMAFFSTSKGEKKTVRQYPKHGTVTGHSIGQVIKELELPLQ